MAFNFMKFIMQMCRVLIFLLKSYMAKVSKKRRGRNWVFATNPDFLILFIAAQCLISEIFQTMNFVISNKMNLRFSLTLEILYLTNYLDFSSVRISKIFSLTLILDPEFANPEIKRGFKTSEDIRKSWQLEGGREWGIIVVWRKGDQNGE